MNRHASTHLDLRESGRLVIAAGANGTIPAGKLKPANTPAGCYVYWVVVSGQVNWLATGDVPAAGAGNPMGAGEGFGLFGVGNATRLQFHATADAEIAYQIGF